MSAAAAGGGEASVPALAPDNRHRYSSDSKRGDRVRLDRPEGCLGLAEGEALPPRPDKICRLAEEGVLPLLAACANL